MRAVNKTPLDRAIDAAAALEGVASGISHIAQACGTSRQFVNKMRRQWRETGIAPRALREHAPAIERALRGQMTADELCPDVAWHRDAGGAITHYAVPVQQENRDAA